MESVTGNFLDFSGKTVLITGAATGIGRAVAIGFARCASKPAAAAALSHTPGFAFAPSGTGSREVLQEFGLSKDDIDALASRRVIG